MRLGWGCMSELEKSVVDGIRDKLVAFDTSETVRVPGFFRILGGDPGEKNLYAFSVGGFDPADIEIKRDLGDHLTKSGVVIPRYFFSCKDIFGHLPYDQRDDWRVSHLSTVLSTGYHLVLPIRGTNSKAVIFPTATWKQG